MSTDLDVEESIERAAAIVGPAWPLHSFVTANPLAGFEDRPFHEAVRRGRRVFGGDGYPDVDVFRRAWATGRIDPEVLAAELEDHGYETDPETSLDRMADVAAGEPTDDGVTRGDDPPAAGRVDDVLTKWLGAFLDQGKAHWPMPDREDGFYAAVRSVARHDREIPDREWLADLPAEPVAAIESVLADYPETRWPAIFEYHLAALPGWTGLINRRVEENGPWQSVHPITLPGYLAVRLVLADLFEAPIESPADEPERTRARGATDTVDGSDGGAGGDAGNEGVPRREVWLSAWERSYRRELVDAVSGASAAHASTEDGGRPDAQLVFCIDTRSEIIRRHVEAAGEYETHGYAGFFGVPMRYDGYESDVPVDACPPIVDAEHRIDDRPTGDHEHERITHDRWSATLDAGQGVVDALKTNAATAFSFVESAGSGYGLALAARTLLPARVYDLLDGIAERVPDDHEFCELSLDRDPGADAELPAGLTLAEKVEYAAAAFELMGWERFARVVAFVGHASRTANNPFDSSLDCGACAGNPGGPSARVLAAICNEAAVRDELRDRGIEVSEDTVFVAGQHDTTTDEVELYDADVPESHAEDLEELRSDLETARAGAATERAAGMCVETPSAADGTAVRETERRAADWAETRPEWGLAGNAAFVIGPRGLTEDLDLDGRSFLHSYDWETDPEGEALEAIMTGPMVVTQWINTQYYFATVDNGVYGSGSKITHNPVGNVGVYQGNGGDLMTSLPLQSLMASDEELYHQPLRLSTVIHAPLDRVAGIIGRHDQLAELLDNGWLSVTVVDPEQDHRAFTYDGELTWVPSRRDEQRASQPTPRTVGRTTGD